VGGHRRLLLVTGATGAIEPAVVASALDSGWRVRALARQDPPPGVLSPDVDLLSGDVRDSAVRRSAVEDVDCIIHLAATLHVTSAIQQAATEYDSLNIDATSALARDAVARGVRRFVFFSTISVYGDTHGTIASESTPLVPGTPYARSKAAAEVALRQQCGGTSCTATGLRLAAVYGPRLKGNYLTMLDRLARGQSLPLLPGSNRRSLVFIDDVARAALLVADHPRAAGRTYNVTDGQVHSIATIVAAMCAALGRDVPHVGIPSWAAAAVVNAGRPLLRGRFADVAALVDKYVEDVAIDGSAIQDELGFQPSVGLREGWRRTARETRISR